jgi:hypothetical protein
MSTEDVLADKDIMDQIIASQKPVVKSRNFEDVCKELKIMPKKE